MSPLTEQSKEFKKLADELLTPENTTIPQTLYSAMDPRSDDPATPSYLVTHHTNTM